MSEKEIEHNEAEYFKQKDMHDQKVLATLLSVLDESKNLTENDRFQIRSCLCEMFESSPNIKKIVENLTPYQYEVVPVLIEALKKQSWEDISIRYNSAEVLGSIGDHRVVAYILANSSKQFENEYVPDLMVKIAAREDVKIKKQITTAFIAYLNWNTHKITTSSQGVYFEGTAVRILDALRKLDAIGNIDRWSSLPLILEDYVRRATYNSEVLQKALLMLSEINTTRANSALAKKMKITKSLSESLWDLTARCQNFLSQLLGFKAWTAHQAGSKLDDRDRVRNLARIVSDKTDHETTSVFFTVLIKENLESESDELPYVFEYHAPHVYFYKNGRYYRSYSNPKRFAGGANSKDEAIQASLDYLTKWLPEINKISIFHKKYRECYKPLDKYFDFARWNFRQSYILAQDFPVVIYDSDFCRVKFKFGTSGNIHDYTPHLQVYYGRLHALSNDDFITWNGEKCWCWHRVDYALNFLDGLSPEEAVKVEYRPRIIEQYRQSDLAKELSAISPAEWMAGMESEIWKHYGQRLFELFDLRRPELWDQYTSFIQEFHKIKKSQSYGMPARDKIC